MKSVKEPDFFKHIKEYASTNLAPFTFSGPCYRRVEWGITFGWEMGKKSIDATKEIFG